MSKMLHDHNREKQCVHLKPVKKSRAWQCQVVEKVV